LSASAQRAARGEFEWVCAPLERAATAAGGGAMAAAAQPIDALAFHPSGKRLLIGARGNSLYALDLKLFTVLRHYPRVRSSLCPVRCGRRRCHALATASGQVARAVSSLRANGMR
jgi:hypothetical protein